MSVFSDDPGILRIREDKARRNHAEAMNFLENDFKSIAQVVQRYWPPAVLAKAAWWAATTNAKDELAKARARFMPVLLQSVVQSRYFQVPKPSAPIGRSFSSRSSAMMSDVMAGMRRSRYSHPCSRRRVG